MLTTIDRADDKTEPLLANGLALIKTDREIVLQVQTEPDRLTTLDPSQVAFRVEAGLCAAGAAIRLSVSILGISPGPCVFDAYWDPNQLESRGIFQQLMAQEEMRVCFQDLKGSLVTQVTIPSEQTNRSEWARTIMRAIAHDLTLSHVDFQKAKRTMMHDAGYRAHTSRGM